MTKKELIDLLELELDRVRSNDFSSWEQLQDLLDRSVIAKDQGYHAGFSDAINFIKDNFVSVEG